MFSGRVFVCVLLVVGTCLVRGDFVEMVEGISFPLIYVSPSSEYGELAEKTCKSIVPKYRWQHCYVCTTFRIYIISRRSDRSLKKYLILTRAIFLMLPFERVQAVRIPNTTLRTFQISWFLTFDLFLIRNRLKMSSSRQPRPLLPRPMGHGII
jgi:hypothetical protein